MNEPDSTPVPAPADERPESREPPSLRRELRAILTLYLVVSILPLLLGWFLAPR